MAAVTDAVIVKPSVRDRLAAVSAAIASPQALALFTLIAGLGLAVAGVYLLAGLGWALLTGAAPLLLLAGILIRGLLYGG